MTERELTFDSLGISREEIYVQMGYGSSVPDATVVSETDAIIGQVKGILRPRFCFFISGGVLDTDEGGDRRKGLEAHQPLQSGILRMARVTAAGPFPDVPRQHPVRRTAYRLKPDDAHKIGERRYRSGRKRKETGIHLRAVRL